jgi:predicted transport protein
MNDINEISYVLSIIKQAYEKVGPNNLS